MTTIDDITAARLRADTGKYTGYLLTRPRRIAPMVVSVAVIVMAVWVVLSVGGVL